MMFVPYKMRWGFILLVLLWSLPVYADVYEQAKGALSAGRNEQAMSILREQVKAYPRDYQAWFLLGVAQAQSQRLHPAIEAFRRVIELRDDLSEPHNNLAVIYNELGDVRAAIAELEISLAKHPDYAVGEENLADLYVKLALEYYKKALEKGDNPELVQRYARLLKVRVPNKTQIDKSTQTVGILQHTDTVPSLKLKQEITLKAVEESHNPVVVDMAAKAKSVVLEAVKGFSDKKNKSEIHAVLKAVETWRLAWQQQDLKGYFHAYNMHIVPSGNYVNVAAWKKYRQRMISKKTHIKVTLSDIKVLLLHGHRAKVKFKQVFRSNDYNKDSMKLLYMEKESGAWKITRELTI